MPFYCASRPKSNGDGIVDSRIDKSCGEALVLASHVITKYDTTGWKWHVLRATWSVKLLNLA